MASFSFNGLIINVPTKGSKRWLVNLHTQSMSIDGFNN